MFALFIYIFDFSSIKKFVIYLISSQQPGTAPGLCGHAPVSQRHSLVGCVSLLGGWRLVDSECGLRLGVRKPWQPQADGRRRVFKFESRSLSLRLRLSSATEQDSNLDLSVPRSGWRGAARLPVPLRPGGAASGVRPGPGSGTVTSRSLVVQSRPPPGRHRDGSLELEVPAPKTWRPRTVAATTSSSDSDQRLGAGVSQNWLQPEGCQCASGMDS